MLLKIPLERTFSLTVSGVDTDLKKLFTKLNAVFQNKNTLCVIIITRKYELL